MCTFKSSKGFTLIELMAAMVVIAVILAIAIPGFQDYSRYAARSAAQQEMLKLAEQLERHKSRNFSYKGFDPSVLYGTYVQDGSTLSFPVGATGSAIKYTIKFVDLQGSIALNNAAAAGRSWGITAIKTNNGSQAKNYDLLLTSTGIRCMTPVSSTALTAYTGCGDKSESWQ